MSFLNGLLLPNEKIIYQCRPHWVVFLAPFTLLLTSSLILYWEKSLLGPLIISMFLVIIFLSLGFSLVIYLTSKLSVTNQRIIFKSGFMRRYSFESTLNRIEAVKFDQGILGRFLNYGAISIHGIGGTTELFNAIPNPLQFCYEVQKQMGKKEKK